MTRSVVWLLAAGVLALPGTGIAATLRTVPSSEATATAGRIDRLLESAWAAKGIQPATRADDAEFLRRVYLDLAGRIPSVAEVRAFLADKQDDKRRRLIAELLERPTYSQHFTTVWRNLLMPEANSNFQTMFMVPGFEAWLRKQFDENVHYDVMVRELLTTTVGQDSMQSVYGRNANAKLTPIAFYMAKETKAENLASATARVFLGIRLECAQCHDHPFAEWKRDQFWSFAAFFGGMKGRDQGDGLRMPEAEKLNVWEIAIPGTNRQAPATFPDGGKPERMTTNSPRKALADWVTGAENPYFAKATVNRVWAYFFGKGLVEPIDEMVGSQETVAHHAELLDELARSFVASGFNLKFLLETIVSTRAYQLTSGGGKSVTGELYSRHPVRGLTAEQLFDSVAIATGLGATDSQGPINVFNNTSPRAEFVTKFGNQSERSTDHETSILHALTLMNGKVIADATNPERSQLLASVLDAPFFTTPTRIETFYLATLSRMPTPKELARATEFLNAATASGGLTTSGVELEKRTHAALADILWSLLNSGEFLLNH